VALFFPGQEENAERKKRLKEYEERVTSTIVNIRGVIDGNRDRAIRPLIQQAFELAHLEEAVVLLINSPGGVSPGT